MNETLLVCSEACSEVESLLAKSGCRVIRVSDGEKAVSVAERKSLDSVVLVSTGEKMDLVETIFNLRDLRPAMPIFIIGDRDANATEVIVTKKIPDTVVLSVKELQSYLARA